MISAKLSKNLYFMFYDFFINLFNNILTTGNILLGLMGYEYYFCSFQVRGQVSNRLFAGHHTLHFLENIFISFSNVVVKYL